MEAPVFAAFGGDDRNVPVEESIERLSRMKKSLIIKVYPDGRHGITDPVSGRVQAEFLKDLVGFINGNTVVTK